MKALVTHDPEKRSPRSGRVGWLIAAAGFALVAGCDSRPSAQPPQTAAAPAIQGELIQPKSVVTNSPSTAASAAPAQASVVPPATNVLSAAAPAIVGAATNGAAASTTNLVATLSDPPKLVDGFLGVGFVRLSAFNFEVTDDILQSGSTNAAQVASRTAEQIPKAVMSFDQKRIALKGFMLPLKVEGGKVTEMLIMRDQSMCCYGAVPKINEWVSVKMVGEGVRPIMDQAVTLYGKLYVGEMRENGYLVGIYRMDGERIDGPSEN